MSSIRNWAVGSAIAALILLSRVVALLIVRAAEMLIDLLVEAGALALFSLVAIGALGWLVLRRRPGRATRQISRARDPLFWFVGLKGVAEHVE
jgi:uncharacterized membrane protein